MKPIKITRENKSTIENALKAVNGSADAHTYTSYMIVDVLADQAEDTLIDLGIPAKYRAGAQWVETSGSRMPNAYAKKASTRIATKVTLQRRKTGWFLVAVERAEIWQQGGGKGRLTLTQEQADIAIKTFASGFNVFR